MGRAYDQVTKAKVLETFVVKGPRAAGLEHGVPAGTVASWASRSGVASVASDNREGRILAAQQVWTLRKLAMLPALADTADKAWAKTDECLDASDWRGARDCATTGAILVDKAQLLCGEATSRVEHGTTEADRVRSVGAMLGSLAA